MACLGFSSTRAVGQCAVLAVVLGAGSACSGNQFTAAGCGTTCGGATGTGGTTSNGGMSGTGGGSSHGGTMGASGSGNPSGGGAGGPSHTGGQGGGTSTNVGFPATKVLDDFNRADGAPGVSWIFADSYSIVAQKLSCTNCGAPAFWSTPFGAQQEAFATYSGFDSAASEMNVILKAQSSSSCEFMEVIYAPSAQNVRIDFCTAGSWGSLPGADVTLSPGDQFGARAHTDGTVEIFVNGKFVTRINASAFPYSSGRIGIDGLGGPDGLHWDDFGGGNWSGP